jgi:hypothetical protein
MIVAGKKRTDGVEAVLRKADVTLEEWLRRSAGTLRQQVDGLQDGLKKLSTGLSKLERQAKPGAKAVAKTATKSAGASRRKSSRSRKNAA